MLQRPNLLEEAAGAIDGIAAALSRTASGSPAALTSFDLITDLEALIHSLGPRAHAVGLELVCRIRPNVPVGSAITQQRLIQVLTLLVEHAIRVTEQGEVALVVSRADQQASLSPFAADWTPQVPANPNPGEPLSLLYEIWCSCRIAGRAAPPAPMEAQLISELGATLTERTEPGTGRVWSFQIALEAATANNREGSDGFAALRDSSILVVDDNTRTRTVLEEILAGWGARVHVADNGETALKVIRQAATRATPFDSLLLDARMPRMSGFEVAQQLAKNPGLCGPVLLLMPAPCRKGDEAFCRRLGVAARIDKPVRRAELLPALETILAGRKPPLPTAERPRSPSLLMPELPDDTAPL